MIRKQLILITLTIFALNIFISDSFASSAHQHYNGTDFNCDLTTYYNTYSKNTNYWYISKVVTILNSTPKRYLNISLKITRNRNSITVLPIFLDSGTKYSNSLTHTFYPNTTIRKNAGGVTAYYMRGTSFAYQPIIKSLYMDF